MSKGSTPRPLSVPQETFRERWEKTFGALRRPDSDVPRYRPHPDVGVSSGWSDDGKTWHWETPEEIAAWWNEP